MDTKKNVTILKDGGVGVVPTDTIYGVVASAFDAAAVERVYTLRKRDLNKPYIVLIGGWSDLKIFDIHIGLLMKLRLMMRRQPTSFVVTCHDKKWQHLHRGGGSIAFRVPKGSLQRVKILRELLQKTGPLIAPSANPAGQEVAQTIKEARDYFGDTVDFYQDGGKIEARASQVIDVRDGAFKILRS